MKLNLAKLTFISVHNKNIAMIFNGIKCVVIIFTTNHYDILHVYATLGDTYMKTFV